MAITSFGNGDMIKLLTEKLLNNRNLWEESVGKASGTLVKFVVKITSDNGTSYFIIYIIHIPCIVR